MSNGGKSMLQELADALAICVRITDSAKHHHPTTTYAVAVGHVYGAAAELENALRVLVAKSEA